MKTSIAAIILISISSVASASLTASPPKHPLFGKWSWVVERNHCTEVYEFRPDNTARITSGEEEAESRITVSDTPDQNGFYRLTDEVMKSNGRTGCDGEFGGTPVGHSVTNYIFFHPVKKEMVMCFEPSFKACIGPMRRMSE
jgi:hypothetical protein